MAFDKLDKYDSGYIAPEDMIGVYDTTHHPDVISRKKTSQQVLREFLDGFDVGGVIEGQITRNEFQNYYHNMSASIDDDKYFELMIRNAWHLSGGEGATANSANRRLIATRPNAQNADMKSSTFSNQGDNNASIVERLRNQALANRTNRSPAIIPPPYQDAPLTPMEIALLGPQGGDHSLPPSVPPVFTASKKMFIDSKNGLNAPGGLTDPQILPSAGVSLCIDRLKASLKSRGSSGFASLQRMFQNMDEDNNQSLSFVELKNTLKQLNMPVIESDVRKLFEHFDRDKSGTIDFGEFVDGMREPLSSSRLALVDMAFTELDIEGIDEVPFERIASQYNSGRHPEVIAKRMTPKLALANFLETFDAGVEVEGKVTRDEFINYYSNVGAAIDSDEYFDILLRSVWDLGSATNLKGEMGSPVRPSGTVRRAMIEPNSKGSGRTSTSRPGSALAVRGSIRGMGGYPGQVTTGIPLIPQQLLQQQIGLLGTSILQPMNGGIRPNAPSIGTSFPSANDAANKAKPYFSYSQGLEKPLTKGAATAAKVLGTRLNPAEKIPDNGLLHLLDRLKATLVSRGPIGFTSLQRVFQSADINGDGTLSLSEFKDALHSMQLNVIESELRQLFQFFDTDDSKSISYDEFVKGLRDDLNENRMSIVLQAFKRLDIGHNELIDIGYLACQYNGEEHPDVRSGYLTGKQALATFMDTFDAGGEIEGRVTKKEFINYYTNMGAVIENDWNFESLVRGVWGLGEGQQPMTYIYNNGPQPATNIPPSSLRTGENIFFRSSPRFVFVEFFWYYFFHTIFFHFHV